MPVYFRSSGSGCLLPALIFSNLLFGWMVFKPVWLWLAVGAALLIIFILQVSLSLRMFLSGSSKSSGLPKNKSNVIDIQGQVLDEQNKID